MRYAYLHGFASGPTSRKAQAFQAALKVQDIHLEIPDLAEGDFEHLTISSQLSVIDRLLRGERARLIGSSMGGYLAALYAATHPEIDRLALLAPAFGFTRRWHALLGAEKLSQWKETGTMDFFHYGHNALRPLSFQLYEDALAYPANPDFRQPVRIFHGTNDDIVPVSFSREFAANHPTATLYEFNSGHELLNVLDDITTSATDFLLS